MPTALRLSKSKYTTFIKCPKAFWLNCFKPELAVVDDATKSRFADGHVIGAWALKLFDGVVDTTVMGADGRPDIGAMCKKTAALVAEGCPAIAEAAFSKDGLYCAVDILRNNGDGTWDVFEVKSSTEIKVTYLEDVAYQRYVLTAAGVKVRDCHLVYINNKYVRNGEIEPKKLFNIEKLTAEELERHSKDIAENIKKAQEIYALKDEPVIDIHENCNKPYDCPFYAHCSKHLPSPNIFDIHRLGTDKKFAHYRNGIVSFEDIRRAKISLNPKQKRQVDHGLDDLPMFVDKKRIPDFLATVKFPVYFLDFETYQSVLPLFDGLRPYQQVPFQYSLHILRDKGAEKMEHKEFLADENKNEWRALAERMLADIPADGGSVVVYNHAFEMTRIKEMAEAFPDLKARLLDINARMVDLLDVFAGGYMYNRAMGGSFSIKSVLPALCPDNPDLDYHKLPDIHNGGEAMAMFLELRKMDKPTRDRIRQSMLMYCCLDTMAMAVVYKELCIRVLE